MHPRNWIHSLMRSSSSSLSSTEQIQTGSHIQQWIITGFKALDSGDWVEDGGPLQFIIVVRHFVQLDGPQFDNLAVLGPMHGRIICDIAFLGNLYRVGKGNATVDDACLYLVVQVRGILGLGFFIRDMRLASIRRDAVADCCNLAVGGNEFEGIDTKVLFCRKARRKGFRCAQEGTSRRGFAQKDFDWRGTRRFVVSGRLADGNEEIVKRLTSPYREEGGRMSNHVGVLALPILVRQVETQCKASWVRIGIIVGNDGDTSRV